MKTGKGKNKKRRRQQQVGRPVLLTFYIARPARDGGAAATASAHHHRRLHGHGDRHEWPPRRMGWKAKIDGYNRRAELLEYSKHLRALARQMTTQPPAPAPRPRSRETTTNNNTVGVGVALAHVAADQPPAAEIKNRLSLAGWRQRHERAARSLQQQQQIRQRCFGSWSWKRVLVLVFPFNSSKSTMRPRRRTRDDGRDSNRNNNQKGSPAALLLGKLKASRASRDSSSVGLLSKKLMSLFRFRQRS